MSKDSTNNVYFTYYLTRLFLFGSGLLITVYSLLGIFLYFFTIPIPIFTFIYFLGRELFYNFLGLFWVQLRYYIFFPYVPLSFLLLFLGLIQLLFVTFASIKSSYYVPSVVIMLLIELTFLPLGIFSLYILYILFASDHSQFQDLSFHNGLFESTSENKSAMIVLLLLTLDFIILLGFLILIRALTTTASTPLDMFLILMAGISAIAILGSSCTIGLLYFTKKLFLMGSISIGILSFIIFYGIVLILSYFYPSVHDNITLLAPLSMFMLANAILDVYLYTSYKKINFEVL